MELRARRSSLGSCASTDIARSDCPVPHLGQRCRVLPVNVSSDSVRDFRALVAIQPPGVTQESILWREARTRYRSAECMRSIQLFRKSYARRYFVLGQRGSRDLDLR